MNPVSTEHSERMQPRTFVTWLFGATLLALMMRLLFLDRPSFWIDEIYSVMHSARLGEGNITKQFGFLPTYLTLKIAGALPSASVATDPSTWKSLGVDEWLVRLPSVLIGTATVFILGWLARPIIGARAAILFAILLAISTWHLHMSQTGRFYTQQLLFFNMSMLLFYHATSTGNKGRLIASLVCLFAAFMSQPPAILLGVVFGIDWIFGFFSKDSKRLTMASAVAGGITAILSAGLLLYDITRNTENWAQFGQTTSQSTPVILAGAIWYMNPVVALAAGTGFLCLIQRNLRLALYLVLTAFVPLLIMAGLALTDNFVHVRYTFVILPAWLLLAAVAFDRISLSLISEYPFFIRNLAFAMVMVVCLYQDLEYYTAGGGYQPAWREAFEELDQMLQPGEVIYGDFHAQNLGAYYLEEDAITKVTSKSLMPFLDEATEPCWIIDKVGTSGGLNWPSLRDRADLIWTYDRHIMQPYSSIKLFKYKPTPVLSE